MAGRKIASNQANAEHSQNTQGQGFDPNKHPQNNGGDGCDRQSPGTSEPHLSATRVEATNAIALANREIVQELGSFLAMGAEAQSTAMKQLAAQAKPLFNGEHARSEFFKHLSAELADTPPEFPQSLVIEPVDEIFSLDLDITEPLQKLRGVLHGERRKALPSA